MTKQTWINPFLEKVYETIPQKAILTIPQDLTPFPVCDYKLNNCLTCSLCIGELK